MSFRNSPWNNRPKEGYFIMTKDEKSPLGTQIVYCSKYLEEAKRVFSGIANKDHFWIEDILGQKITL